MKSKWSFSLLLILISTCLFGEETNNAILDDEWRICTKKISEEDVLSEGERFHLPEEHQLNNSLKKIFTKSDVIKNKKEFKKANFTILHERPSSLIVAKHPALKGYLVKAYLKSTQKPGRSWKDFVNRCKGAENIQILIEERNMQHFTVPKKWIYCLPGSSLTDEDPSVILIVEDMDLVSNSESKKAWRILPTYEILEELYQILSRGYSSCRLPLNIPYTKKGTFSCIDTEHPSRALPLHHVKLHISDEMESYWDELVGQGGGALLHK